MPWEPWPYTEQRTLARYANPETARLLPKLIKNPGDLRTNPDGKSETLKLIYNTLCMCSIDYDLELPNLQSGSQIIRQPAAILSSPHQATCLDLALLIGGLCLHYDLLPLLVLIKNHAFLAIATKLYQRDLVHEDRDELQLFEQGMLPNEKGEALREWIDKGILLPLECTGIAFAETLDQNAPEGKGRTSGRMLFDRAVKAGHEQLKYVERPFLYALDLHEIQFRLNRPPYPIDLPPYAINVLPGVAVSQQANTYTSRTAGSSSFIVELKRTTLLRRKDLLVEEYEAINRQADHVLDEVMRLRLLRQAGVKLAEIEEVVGELEHLG